MIRPREFEVDNGEGIKPDIRIDPETRSRATPFGRTSAEGAAR